MTNNDGEARIALFLDYENLAIGARDHLRIRRFDYGPIARAMAERGRVLVRRAYADWSYFDEDRRALTRHHVELIDIPQKMGASRKNAADIKLAVDAMELALERDYVTTFVICTGDSDLTPLVHKLRELDRRVIGIGVRDSTSKLLPPSCDEFLYYDRLEGVEAAAEEAADTGSTGAETAEEQPDVDTLVVSTISGMQTAGEAVRGSTLKRAMLRIDPTFSEVDLGFRNFTEFLRNLEGRGLVELSGQARDPEVDLLTDEGPAAAAFDLLVATVREEDSGQGVPMSGLKTEIRRRDETFSERRFGFSSFRQFCKAAAARGLVEFGWDDGRGDYLLRVPA
jgi:uncharacterized LabA/DUF88 family protein